MTGDQMWSSSLTPVMTKEYITFGDNGKCRVHSVGMVKVSEFVTLRRVALVKSFGFNLLSVSQLLDEHFGVRFKMGALRVLDSRGDHVCMIIPEVQIFRADFFQCVDSSRCLIVGISADLWKWHRRLGHLSFDLLSRLSRLGLVRGSPKLKYRKNLVCAPYRHGKMVAASHPPRAWFAVLWVIREIIVPGQGKKPSSSTMATTVGSATTTTTIKGGTQAPTFSIITMEVIILTISTINPPLKILSWPS
jgi:hypothetical protein